MALNPDLLANYTLHIRDAAYGLDNMLSAAVILAVMCNVPCRMRGFPGFLWRLARESLSTLLTSLFFCAW